MNHGISIYKLKDWLASILMLLALLWLTISLPFVYDAQQQTLELNHKEHRQQDKPSMPDNPLTNTTEEKPLSSMSAIEEYLHDYSPQTFNGVCEKKMDFPHYDENLYLAFHVELISPPPNLQA